MPSKYVIRNFSENQYYHVFNRGVEKRKIFLDEQDYKMFTYYLFIYLSPIKQVLEKYPQLPIRLQAKNLSKEVDLISYCLMPNHFHLLVKQQSKNAISKFVKQLTNAYTTYFNVKYKRIGGLFQGVFKAVHVTNDELLLHVSRYIHLNPIASGLIENIEKYNWSSYPDYLSESLPSLCKREPILSLLPSRKYKDFVLDQVDFAKELEKIKHLLIEDD